MSSEDKRGARAKAEEALKPGMRRAIWTDMESKPGTVIVGIATPTASCAMVVDAKEWRPMDHMSEMLEALQV